MNDIINKQLLLELFLSRLETESFKSYREDFNKFLDEVIAKAPYIQTTADKRALREYMNETLKPMYNNLMTSSIAEAKTISLFETALLYEMYGVASKTAETYLATINSQTEIHGYKIGDSFKNNREFLSRRLGAIIANGVEQNETSIEIKRGIKKAGEKQLAHVSNGLINSVIQKARSLERENTYRVIEKEVEGCYEFVATLDNRTTKICSSSDGRRFCKKLDEVPSDYKPPLHFRCRSILCFSPKDYQSQNTRASKQYNVDGTSKGKQIQNMNYSEWFATQPSTIQKKYLGKKNYELYKSGVPFTDLFRNARKFSMKDIEGLF